MYFLGSARTKSRTVLALAVAAAVGTMTVGTDVARAADGTWTDLDGGLWGDTANWTGGVVADAGGVASFNTVNLSGDLAVTLDAPRTLSTLTVVDTTPSSGGRYFFTDAGVPANTLTLSGAVNANSGGISLGATMSAAALNVGAVASGARPTFSIDGGAFTATATSTINGINSGGAGQFILNSGSATFAGLTTNNADNAIIRIAGGTFSATDLTVQRNSAGSVSFTGGVIVTGGTSTVGTVQIGSNNSNGAMSIEGGSFTATGPITIGRQQTSGRGGGLRVTGGTFTSTDAADGIILSRQDEIANGGQVNQVSTATFSGGVSTVEKFTLGYDAGSSAGSATLTVNNTGTLYVGSGGIVRNGSGTFTSTVSLAGGTLGARTDWSSTVNMNLPTGGNINIKAADALDAARNITLNGVISGPGGFTKIGAGTLTLGGTNTYAGTATVSQGTLAGTSTSLRGTIANNSNVTFDQSTDGTFTGSIGGTGSVTKAGTGTVTLSPQTYTGATTVAGGTLAISGAHTATSGFAVQNGATLALAGNASVNAMTLGATASDAQSLRVNTGSGVNGLGVLATDGLVAHGTTTIDVGSLGLAVGTYTVLDYAGAIGGTGGGFGAFTLGALPPRVTAGLVNNTGNTSIDLNISSIAEPPRWSGAVNGNWDVGTLSPASGTQNWTELNNGNPTVYLESAVPGDQVVFDDAATGTTSVNIVTSVNPALLTVNNPTKNYTFGGAKIGGPTPLLKQGAGSLTLNNAGNDYTGGTSIQGGTMLLGVANALPTAGNVTIAGGALNLGGLSHDLSGAIVLESGTIADGTVNKSGANYDLRSGAVSASLAGAVGLAKTTAGTLALTGAASYTGATAIQNGTVQLGVANALPTGTAVTLGSGADSGVLNLNGFSQQVSGLTTSGTGTANGLTNSSATPATFAVNLASGTPTFAGAISGSLTFEKQGAGTLNLTGANTYTGGTNLNGGILSFTGGALGTTGSVAFTGSSTLRWATGNTEDVSPRLAALPSGVTATLDTNGQNITLNGAITGAGGLAKAGGGTLLLNAANTHAGGTLVTAGNVRAGNNSALGTGPVQVNTGSLQLDNGVSVTNDFVSNSQSDNMIDVPSGSATYAGNVSVIGTGNQLRVAATGGGTLNFTGTAPLPGFFVLNAGDVVLSNSASITGGTALLGRPGSEFFMALTLRDNASMAFTTLTNIGNARQVPDASLTIQDSASYSTGTTFNLLDTTTSPATSTINLDGGTLTAGSFLKTSTGVDQTATINFNGGTLRPSASNTAFLPALAGLTAQVHNGGAVIDTNGFDAGVGLALVAAGGSTGGLTKNGAGTLTLSAVNTHAGGTTVNAGALLAANADALGAGPLAVASGATARAQAGLAKALDLPAPLGITASGPTGGTLDLTDGALVVRHAGQAAALAGHAAVNALVRNAFNEFAWNQPGITSSTVAADVAAGIPAAVGILLNNDGGGNALFYGDGTALPQFEGRSVDGNSVLVKTTLLGDGDLNGTVDSVDFALFQAGYTGAAPYVGFAFGDYDYNGVIDSVDFGLFQAGYQYSQSNPTPEMVAFADEHHLSLVAAAVPEPTMTALVALGASALLSRSRTRRR